jgi:uncharacterized protein YecE (DUF72 family)
MKFGQVEQLDTIDFDFKPISLGSKQVLNSFDKKPLQFYFGGPGWSDKQYKGILYPMETSQKDYLRSYATQFNSIEVNATRYSTPKVNVLDNWMNQVGEGFKFSMKVPQVVTHRKDINHLDARYKLEEFIAAVAHLNKYSGISFAVMANYFRASQFKELEKFISFWPRDAPLSIEFRDPSWFEQSVELEWQHLFKENNLVSLITDTPGRRDVAHFNLSSDELFIRYVGDFDHPSDKTRISDWVNKIKELRSFGLNKVWFYVHQPGENRSRIIGFYNMLIGKLNLEFDLNLKPLVNYSK